MTAVLLGWAFDLVLAGLLLVLGWRAVASRDLFAGIVFYIAYGLLMAVAWVRLGAPDVALAEAAIGAGLTGVLLLGTLGRIGVSAREPSAVVAGDAITGTPAGGATRAAGRGRLGVERLGLALSCALLAVGLAAAVLALPADTAGLAAAAARHLPESGVENPVTAVLLNYRGYDTLLETGVLLLALLGAWSLCPDPPTPGGGSGRPAGAADPPDAVLDTFVRLLVPVALLVGVYLLWAGGHAPGGAFQAGTVLAAAAVLPRLAGLPPPPAIGRLPVRALVTAGFLVFIGVGVYAMVAGRGFLAYPPGTAKPLILLIEAVLTISIALTLALLVAGGPEPLRKPRR
ncbi:MAG TPA: hydrogenase subunit MbhD domain-containing protein [Geminicoccaceae bacterium]|nr:hydrogenase subunit MbhD domain-containing protein [Geminicoccaceae bacterium]